MRILTKILFALIMSVFLVAEVSASSGKVPSDWKKEWPATDFSRSTVDFKEIISGGQPRDGIPSISYPVFKKVSETRDLGQQEPVVVVTDNEEARAYPLRVLIWHEIVNDQIGDIPIIVTYCPLCNTSIVFERRLNGQELNFGVSGKLRHSDMIMFDRQTDSWWQQFNGDAIVGKYAGQRLKRVTSRLWPYGKFAEMYPLGKVLVPRHDQRRPYGENPYEHYDTAKNPFLFKGKIEKGIPPLAYVIAIDDQAWPLSLIRQHGELSAPPYILRWHEGMNSALDKQRIAEGRDIGFVEVVTISGSEEMPVTFVMTFAFAFKAFHPEGIIHSLSNQ